MLVLQPVARSLRNLPARAGFIVHIPGLSCFAVFLLRCCRVCCIPTPILGLVAFRLAVPFLDHLAVTLGTGCLASSPSFYPSKVSPSSQPYGIAAAFAILCFHYRLIWGCVAPVSRTSRGNRTSTDSSVTCLVNHPGEGMFGCI